MGLGELLNRIRAHYLERLLDVADQHALQDRSDVILEAPFLDANGDVAREGPHKLPMRGDIFVVREGSATDSLHVDTENMLGFEPIAFDWNEVTSVELLPFQWNWCPVALQSAEGLTDLSPLLSWFMQWFENRTEGDGTLQEVVHYMSDPEVTETAIVTSIDFGSAPVTAFEDFLDACSNAGASNVRIGASAGA